MDERPIVIIDDLTPPHRRPGPPLQVLVVVRGGGEDDLADIALAGLQIGRCKAIIHRAVGVTQGAERAASLPMLACAIIEEDLNIFSEQRGLAYALARQRGVRVVLRSDQDDGGSRSSTSRRQLPPCIRRGRQHVPALVEAVEDALSAWAETNRWPGAATLPNS